MNDTDRLAVRASAAAPDRAPLVAMQDVDVTFGVVRALKGANFTFFPGECVAIAGHNGAGKSTLMSVLAGARRATGGGVAADGVRHERGYGADVARRLGVRCVFQELSLCPNLTIDENMRAVAPRLRGWGWRGKAAGIMAAQLDAIFPGHGLRGGQVVGDLSLTQQQMVEIARGYAQVDVPARLVILDEPTSSLDRYTAEQLLAFIRRSAAAGVTTVLITHMLDEMLRCADRVMVMRDGAVVSTLPVADLNKDGIIRAMGQFTEHGTPSRAPDGNGGNGGNGGATASDYEWDVGAQPGAGVRIAARRGSIVGFAGLAGQGQTTVLNAIYRQARARGSSVRVAYVAGDRRADGIFPDWNIARNFDIRSLFDRRAGLRLDPRRQQAVFARWAQRLDIRGAPASANIQSLSGGNQQKVLFGRALASDADLILMDDPMRGVDIGTKRDIYALLQEEAARGRTFLWYTTENDELSYCDKTYVFRSGRVTRELTAGECSEEALLAASFAEPLPR